MPEQRITEQNIGNFKTLYDNYQVNPTYYQNHKQGAEILNAVKLYGDYLTEQQPAPQPISDYTPLQAEAEQPDAVREILSPETAKIYDDAKLGEQLQEAVDEETQYALPESKDTQLLEKIEKLAPMMHPSTRNALKNAIRTYQTTPFAAEYTQGLLGDYAGVDPAELPEPNSILEKVGRQAFGLAGTVLSFALPGGIIKKYGLMKTLARSPKFIEWAARSSRGAKILTKTPLVQRLINSVQTFVLHGQIQTKGWEGRIERVPDDAIMGMVFGTVGGMGTEFLKGTAGKVAAYPSMFAVGYGTSKLGGATNEDAIISGALLFFLHAGTQYMSGNAKKTALQQELKENGLEPEVINRVVEDAFIRAEKFRQANPKAFIDFNKEAPRIDKKAAMEGEIFEGIDTKYQEAKVEKPTTVKKVIKAEPIQAEPAKVAKEKVEPVKPIEKVVEKPEKKVEKIKPDINSSELDKYLKSQFKILDTKEFDSLLDELRGELYLTERHKNDFQSIKRRIIISDWQRELTKTEKPPKIAEKPKEAPIVPKEEEKPAEAKLPAKKAIVEPTIKEDKQFFTDIVKDIEKQIEKRINKVAEKAYDSYLASTSPVFKAEVETIKYKGENFTIENGIIKIETPQGKYEYPVPTSGIDLKAFKKDINVAFIKKGDKISVPGVSKRGDVKKAIKTLQDDTALEEDILQARRVLKEKGIGYRSETLNGEDILKPTHELTESKITELKELKDTYQEQIDGMKDKPDVKQRIMYLEASKDRVEQILESDKQITEALGEFNQANIEKLYENTVRTGRIKFEHLPEDIRAEGKKLGINGKNFVEQFKALSKDFNERSQVFFKKMWESLRKFWRDEGGFIQFVSKKEPTKKGISKIGKTIETEAIEEGLTEGFRDLAEYDIKTVKGQASLMSDLMQNIENAKDVVKGTEPLPAGLNPSTVIITMKNYALENKDGALSLELAKSPLVTETSEAAQTLRFARDSDTNSPVKAISEIAKAREESLERKIKFGAQQKQKANLKKSLVDKINKTKPTKYSWESLIQEIMC